MGIDSVVTEALSYNPFSVVVRALSAEAVVMGSYPGINNEPTGIELWTMECWCISYLLKTIFSTHVET